MALLPPRSRSPTPSEPVPVPVTPITGSVSLGQGFSPIPNRPAAVPRISSIGSDSSSRAVTDALEETASSNEEQQQTVAGENSLIPILYGERPVGALLASVLVANSNLYLRCIWCLGEIDSVVSYTINDLPPPSGVSAVHYLGTQTQVADPGLVSAYAANNVTYTDTLLGVAYSVITVQVSAPLVGFPRPVARIRGMKINVLPNAYVVLNGTTEYVSTPHSATMSINEDMEIESYLSMDDWTPAAEQTIVSKWDTANKQYRFAVKATGELILYVSTDGTAETVYTSSVATGFTNQTAHFVRVAFRKLNGANSSATFYVSEEGNTWTALGTSAAAAVIASLYASISTVVVGAYHGGGYLGGKVYQVRVTTPTKVVLEFLPWDQSASLATWTSGTGEVWTGAGSAIINADMRAYSEYPSLALADLIRSTKYGMGKKVDFKTLLNTYLLNSQVIVDGALSQPRHRIGLLLDTSQPCVDWMNVLREYAHCWAVLEGDRYYLPRDADVAVSGTFDEDSIVQDSLVVVKRGARDQPTCVEVTYTNSTLVPWRDDTYTEYGPGVLAGTSPRRMQRINKIGVFRLSEAKRDAIEWLNDATLSDVNISFRVFDNGALPRVGDIVNVTHTVGFVAKPFRVVKTEPYEMGRWTLFCTEYDPALYSAVIVAEPTIVDTAPPPVTTPTTKKIRTAFALGGVGLATPSQTGFNFNNSSSAQVAPASTNLLLSLPRIKITSSSTGNTGNAINSRTQIFWRGNAAGLGGFYLSFTWGIEVINTTWMEHCAGLFNTAGSPPANVSLETAPIVPSGLLNCVFFGADSGQANMRLMHNDSSGVCTQIDLGASFPAETAYAVYRGELFCAANATSISYRINRLDVAAQARGEISTNIPSNTTFLGWQIANSNGSSVTEVSVSFMRLDAESDY